MKEYEVPLTEHYIDILGQGERLQDHWSSGFSLLWLYLAYSQVSVYRTIGPLVF